MKKNIGKKLTLGKRILGKKEYFDKEYLKKEYWKKNIGKERWIGLVGVRREGWKGLGGSKMTDN